MEMFSNQREVVDFEMDQSIETHDKQNEQSGGLAIPKELALFLECGVLQFESMEEAFFFISLTSFLANGSVEYSTVCFREVNTIFWFSIIRMCRSREYDKDAIVGV